EGLDVLVRRQVGTLGQESSTLVLGLHRSHLTLQSDQLLGHIKRARGTRSRLVLLFLFLFAFGLSSGLILRCVLGCWSVLVLFLRVLRAVHGSECLLRVLVTLIRKSL